jgi:hypothetical protein
MVDANTVSKYAVRNFDGCLIETLPLATGLRIVHLQIELELPRLLPGVCLDLSRVGVKAIGQTARVHLSATPDMTDRVLTSLPCTEWCEWHTAVQLHMSKLVFRVRDPLSQHARVVARRQKRQLQGLIPSVHLTNSSI